MKGPLFYEGQPVVCINDNWKKQPGPEPRKGEIYHVGETLEVQGAWLITLREFPSEGGQQWCFEQEFFAPIDGAESDEVNAEADAAVRRLLQEVGEGVLV